MKSEGRRSRLVTAIALWVAAAGLAAQAPVVLPSKSADHAKELAMLMPAQKLEAFGAVDPDDKTRFVAVMHLAGIQLMVVAGNYERPDDMAGRIFTKAWMDLYVDLNTSVMTKNKIFIEDAGCDGLRSNPPVDSAADTVTTSSGRRTFDGNAPDPKNPYRKKLVPLEEYTKSFTSADETYDKLLVILLNALKK